MPRKTEPHERHEHSHPEGMGWRVSVSILSFFGLVACIVLWLFFYADRFSLYQNVAVLIVGLLGFVALNAAVWAPWGMKHGGKCGKCCEEMPKKKK